MKLKKEYLILLIVIAALVLYLVLRQDDAANGDLPQPAALQSNRIDRVLIDREDGKLELIKKDERWTIEPQGYPVDPAQITNILNTIANLRLTALVSESGSYERYDLGPKQKIVVQAFEGQTKVREFDVGQVAPTIRHTFVKLADNPNVYHAQGAFKNHFDLTTASLRDKTVLAFETNAIDTLEIKKGKDALTLTQKEIKSEPAADQKPGGSGAETITAAKKEWRNDQGQAADQDEVGRLLSAMAGLKCEAFLDERKPSEFESPMWSVTFGGGGQTRTLSVFAKAKEEDTQAPALSSTNPYVFTLSTSRIETFEKQLNALLGIKVKETEQTK